MNKDKWEAFKNQATEFKQKAAAKATELGERAIEKKNELQLKAADKLRRQKPDEPAQVILLPSLFGMPLQEAVETSLPSALPFIVPSIVWTCCDYIDKNGLQEVGIYRLSGSLSCINDIRTSFTVSYEYEIQEKDVHAVAGFAIFI